MLEEDSTGEQADGGEDATAGDESGGDDRVGADTHGDTTESSGGGADVGGDDGGDDDAARNASSPVPTAGSDSDSTAYRERTSSAMLHLRFRRPVVSLLSLVPPGRLTMLCAW